MHVFSSPPNKASFAAHLIIHFSILLHIYVCFFDFSIELVLTSAWLPHLINEY